MVIVSRDIHVDMVIAKLKNKYEDYLYERRLQLCILSWIQKHADTSKVVQFNLHTRQETFVVTEKAWTKLSTDFEADFIVYRTENSLIAEKIGLLADEKITIFSSEFLEVVEIIKKNSPRQIRHGLTNLEKQQLLAVSYAHVEQTLLQIPIPNDLTVQIQNNPLFNQLADADVVVWVNGKIRGSIIKTGLSLIEAIKASTKASLSDSRFRPVESSELNQVTLEINIMSDLYIPLPPIGTNTNFEEKKGYFVTHKNNSGWYLPVVFKTRKYQNLSHLLTELATKKASIAIADLPRVTFYMFDVCTLTKKQTPSLPLDVEQKIDLAASWLRNTQEASGFIPTIVSPYDFTKLKADWVRMALAAYALKLYGITANKEEYSKSANLTYNYISSRIDTLSILSHQNYTLTVIYLCRVAILNNDWQGVRLLFAKIEPNLHINNFSIITRLQLASLYTEMAQLDEKYRHLSTDITDAEFCLWEAAVAHKNPNVSYAEYAELIPLLHRYCSHNVDTATRYQKIITWYTNAQLKDGAFPNTQTSSYSYTRGTGKIFEAMSIDMTNLPSCQRSLQWILNLQHSAETLFTVTDAERIQLQGSIKHDPFDHTAWTDSISHLLIGVVRLKNIEPGLFDR